MNNHKTQKNKKGSAVAYAIMMIVVIAIIISSLMQFIMGQLKYGYAEESKQSAFEVAEAGASFYSWYLAHKTDGKTSKQISDFWTTGSPLGVGTGNEYESEYKDPWSGETIGRYRIAVDPPITGSTIANATIEGWTNKYPNIKRTLKIRFRRASWSEYMFLSNIDMGFGSNRIVNGKFHTNGGLRFDGTRITGKATSTKFYSGYVDPDYGERAFGIHIHNGHDGIPADPQPPVVVPSPPTEPPTRNTIFQGGRGYAPEKAFTSVATDMTLMKADAAVIYNRAGEIAASALGRHITFTNSTFTICKVATASKDVYNAAGEVITTIGNKNFTENSCVANIAIPDNGIIYIENDVWVDGAIDNKKVTVVANNPLATKTSEKFNIYLGRSNLTYAASSNIEILGLVAQNNIEIIRDSQNNLIVSAALLAVDGRVFRNTYLGSYKNSITINGAIATNLRYRFNETGCGYNNATFNFDGNLLDTPPPYFPTGDQYLVDMWEEI